VVWIAPTKKARVPMRDQRAMLMEVLMLRIARMEVTVAMEPTVNSAYELIRLEIYQ